MPSVKMPRVLFVSGEMKLPFTEPDKWDDATLIAFIDAYEADMRLVPEDVALPWAKSTSLFFAAWLELHDRTV